jgi:alpha-L-arabinofuranosidase
LLPTQVATPDYELQGVKIPSLSVSASRAASGEVTLSLVNLDPRRDAKLQIDTNDQKLRTASGRVMTAASMDARPEFDQPDPLEPARLEKISVRRGAIALVAPAKSVVVLKIR